MQKKGWTILDLWQFSLSIFVLSFLYNPSAALMSRSTDITWLSLCSNYQYAMMDLKKYVKAVHRERERERPVGIRTSTFVETKIKRRHCFTHLDCSLLIFFNFRDTFFTRRGTLTMGLRHLSGRNLGLFGKK